MTKSVLVTGGAGYIGSHVALCLLDQEIDVIIIDNLSTGQRALAPAGATFIEGDIADTRLVRKALHKYNCRSVMHFAASTDVAESMTNPQKYIENNTNASTTLINNCIASGVKNFVFSSTAAVYGKQDSALISEDATLAPMSPYGQSKQHTEETLIEAATTHGMNYAILRYFNVAGADTDGRSGQASQKATHLFASAVRAVLNDTEMKIFGADYATSDGTCVRDFIHVSDLAEIHLRVLNHLIRNQANIILNCGYAKGFSVRQVIDIVSEEAGCQIKTRCAERRDGDIISAIADTTRLHQTISWKPAHDIRTIARTALNWAR